MNRSAAFYSTLLVDFQVIGSSRDPRRIFPYNIFKADPTARRHARKLGSSVTTTRYQRKCLDLFDPTILNKIMARMLETLNTRRS